MPMLNMFGFAKRKCPRCDAVAEEAAVFCSSCGVTLASPPNDTVLRANRWEPAADELASFFGIGQLKGVFTKTLHVPLGARAVVLQDDRVTEVPCGAYEVEGFFSRLANLLRDRPAEILVTREAALQILMEFSVLSAEFLKLDGSLTVGVKVGDVAAFAGQFMGRPGSVKAGQLRELLEPAVMQALSEFTGAYSLRELALNSGLRAAVEARILGNAGLKATLGSLGLEIDHISAVALKHEKYSANRELQGTLWLVADERRVQLEHRKQLDELYSEEEWAAIDRERGEIERRLRRRQLQADEGVDSAKQVQATREQMQALRERDLELYERLLASQTREQALALGAKEQVETLEHELKGKQLLRNDEAERWKQVQDLARLRRGAELSIAQLQSDKVVREQLLMVGHTLRLQEFRQGVEAARLIQDERARDDEFARAQEKLATEHQRGRDLADSQHGLNVQTLDLEQQARRAVFERQQRWEEVQAKAKQLDVVRQAALDDARSEDAIDRLKGAREREDAQFAIDRWKEFQGSKLSLAHQAEIQSLEVEIKRGERKEQDADRAMQRELLRIRETARIELDRYEQELRKLGSQQDHELDKIREVGKLDVAGKIATAATPNAQLLKELESTKHFAGMTAAQILAAQVAAAPGAAQAIGEVARAEATVSRAGTLSVEESLRLNNEAQERERRHQAEMLAQQRAHELEIIRQRDQSAAHAIGQQTALGVGVAAAHGQGTQPPVIVPPVVAGAGFTMHNYPSGVAGLRPPCDLCHLNSPEARFCSNCGRQLRT